MKEAAFITPFTHLLADLCGVFSLFFFMHERSKNTFNAQCEYSSSVATSPLSSLRPSLCCLVCYSPITVFSGFCCLLEIQQNMGIIISSCAIVLHGAPCVTILTQYNSPSSGTSAEGKVSMIILFLLCPAWRRNKL